MPGRRRPRAPPTGLFRPGVPFRVLVEEAERSILEQAISHHGGQMAATARGLGLERSHLYKKCSALGLREKAEDDDASRKGSRRGRRFAWAHGPYASPAGASRANINEVVAVPDPR